MARRSPTASLVAICLWALGLPARAQNAPPEPVQVTAAPGQGFTFTADDGRGSLTLKPRLQLRDTFTQAGATRTNEAQLKTLRLWLQGHVLSKELRYGVQLAFGGNDFDGFKDGAAPKSPTSASPVFDAFVEYAAHRDFVLKVGQFFVPFDRARTIREFALSMVDRPGVVSELTLDRDFGVALSSNDLLGRGAFGYALFLGGGRGRNAFGAYEPSRLATARLTWHPFGAFDEDQESDLTRSASPRLAFGLAAGRSTGVRRQRVTTGDAYTAGTAAYRHAAVDIVFKQAGFSLLAENVWRRADDDTLEATVADKKVKEWTRSGAGRFIQGGYLGKGGVEVVGRWEQLVAHAGTDPRLVEQVASQGRTVAVGLNRYFNGHALKVQTDWGWTYGNDFDRGRHVARLQLDATF
jgi:hypothetical protein